MRHYRWGYSWLLGCLLLSGCGFQLSRPPVLTDPQAYHSLNIIADNNTPASLTTDLNQILRANHIANAPQSVPPRLWLRVTQYHDDTGFQQHPITSSSIATPITYHISATVQLETTDHHPITPMRPLLIAHTVYINTNQIQTPGTNHTLRQSMQQQLARLIDYWLTSPPVQAEVHHALAATQMHGVPHG